MNAVERAKEKLEQGHKLHGDVWNSWSCERLLTEAQDEIADCLNYLEKYIEKKHLKIEWNFTQHIIYLRNLFYLLEKMKQEEK